MNEILKEIQDSFRYILFKKGWDDEGAEPMDLRAYSRALELLFNLINTVGVIKSPEINLCPDGSVDVAFSEDKKTILLINVKSESVSWYGDDGFGGDVVSGNQVELYNKDLFDWVKKKLIINNI